MSSSRRDHRRKGITAAIGEFAPVYHSASPGRAAALSSGQPARALSVLVVTSDGALRERLTTDLREYGCTAVGLSEMPATSRLQADGFNLLVLDVQFDAIDGFDVLRRVRLESEIPIILLTRARRDHLDDVIGLEFGADDVLAEPINPRELLARGRAILRRFGRACTNQLEGARGGWRFMGWELRCRKRTLTDPAGRIVRLTRNEYALLNAFLEAPRRPLSRLELMRAMRPHEDILDRTIDGQVLRLRRKLQPHPSTAQLIKTKRSVGYVLDVDVEQIP